MNVEQRLKVLEEEFKILKNEVKTILLDLREQYLNIQNPFNYNMTPNGSTTAMGANPEQQDEIKEVGKAKLNNIFNTGKNNKASENKQVTENTLVKEELAALSEPEFSNFSNYKPMFSPEIEISLPGLNSGNALLEPQGFGGENCTPGSRHGSSEMEWNDAEFEDESVSKVTGEHRKGIRNKKDKDKDAALPIASGRFDLVIIAGLTQWVDQAAAKLGKERAEALVEMSCTMGRIPENLKDVLIKMARLSRHESNGQTSTAADYLALLAQLENLLGGSEIQDKALLSILSMMKGTGNG